MKTTVLLGAPGSGKGTQAKKLAGEKVLHLSTGDMLRAEIKAESPLGLKVKEILARGELVSDDVMIEMIQSTFSKLDSDTHVLLDGFPRTVPQAEALDQSDLTAAGTAVYFKIPESELVERLTGRRICANCGTPFHIKFVPPKSDGVCDACNGELKQRPDDTEEVVVNRLQIFWKQNQGLLDYYQGKNKLKEVDANRDVDAIQKDLMAVLEQ